MKRDITQFLVPVAEREFDKLIPDEAQSRLPRRIVYGCIQLVGGAGRDR